MRHTFLVVTVKKSQNWSFIHSFIHIRLFSVVKTQPNMN